MKLALQIALAIGLSASIGYVASTYWKTAPPAAAAQPAPDTPSLIEPDIAPERPLLAGEAFSAIVEAHGTRDTFTAHYRTMVAAELLHPAHFGSLSLLMANEPGREWPVLRIIVLLKWIERDSRAVMAFLETHHAIQPLAQTIPGLFRYWASTDPEAAIAAAAGLSEKLRRIAWLGFSGLKDDPAMAALLARHDQAAPPATIGDFTDALSAKLWKTDRNAFNNLVRSRFSADPKATLQAILSISDLNERQSALHSLSNHNGINAKTGIQALLDLRASGALPQTDFLYHVFGNFIRGSNPENSVETVAYLAERLSVPELLTTLTRSPPAISTQAQFDTLYGIASALPASNNRNQLITQLFQGWASRDWQTAFVWAADNLPSGDYERQVPLLVSSAYSNGGSTAAVALFDSLPSESSKSKAVQNLAHTWGQKDPLAFAEWSMTLESDALAAQGLKDVAHQLNRNDPAAFEMFTEVLPEGSLKEHYQAIYAQSLVSKDPLSAIQYAATKMNAQAAQRVTESALSHYAQTDPVSAIEIAAANTANSSLFNNSIRGIASTWANKDAKAALEYFEKSADPNVRDAGLNASVSSWAGKEPQAAVNYTAKLPNGDARDSLLLMFAHRYPQYPAELKRELDQAISTISDPSKRTQAIQAVNRQR